MHAVGIQSDSSVTKGGSFQIVHASAPLQLSEFNFTNLGNWLVHVHFQDSVHAAWKVRPVMLCYG